MNRKLVIGIVLLAFCVILSVLLGVLLPRQENDDSDSLLDLPESSPWYDNEEIRIFRQYLRIPTAFPNINYEPCVEFLRRQAINLDLPMAVYYPVDENNPVVVMTWLGSEPNRPSVMLNSHTDVVPAYGEFWSYPPFDAHMDEVGRIFARGSQDTKAVGTMYLAAIRALKRDGITQLKRTFHITFVPDEEMGGLLGMYGFVRSEEFRALNIGYALDEGMVSLTNQISVSNDERCVWRIEIICRGVTGHGSILFENTTGEKISFLINKFMERRQIEMAKLSEVNFVYANVTTINLTIVKGGIQGNVIPPELSVILDVRLAINADHDEFEKQINQWCDEAGGNITVNYLIKDIKVPATRTDETNPLWVVLDKTTKELGLEIIAEVPMPTSDMRYLRRLNIPALGFSPLINTPTLAHDHNEYVQADEYLAGINVYKRILSNLGDI